MTAFVTPSYSEILEMASGPQGTSEQHPRHANSENHRVVECGGQRSSGGARFNTMLLASPLVVRRFSLSDKNLQFFALKRPCGCEQTLKVDQAPPATEN
jgi:hypothetical protein